MLATPGRLPDDPVGWAHELKWDGVRVVARIRDGAVRLTSRSGREVTASYPELGELGTLLRGTAILDGELVALDEEARASFQLLQRRVHVADPARARRLAVEVPVAYLAFDLCLRSGRWLLTRPYEQRRAELAELGLAGEHVAVPAPLDVGGDAALELAASCGVEGVVAKRRDSAYLPGTRSAGWVKAKLLQSAEVVICGFVAGSRGRSTRLGSLVVGVPGPSGLEYAGRVGTGFSQQVLSDLAARLETLRVRAPPLRRGARRAARRTDVGTSRARRRGELPAVDGLGPASSAVVAWVAPRPRSGCSGAAGRSAAMSAEDRVEAELDGRRLSLSNLEKVLYPSTGFTKGDLIAYYVSVGPVLAAHLAGRPATFKRYPDGVDRPSFFEKNIPRHAPDWVRKLRVPRLGRSSASGAAGSTTIDYAVLDDVPSIAWAANLATIELHVPMWRAEDGVVAVGDEVEPDTLVLDLDPGAPATVVECCRVALELLPRLEQLGLSGLAKTSGRKGLQVYAPLRPPRPWLVVHDQALELARAMEVDSGGHVISNMRRDRREGRVLLDWSQNHPAKTTVAPYSLRAAQRPGVSTPVSWEEVERCAGAADPSSLGFEPGDVLARLDELGDLFSPLSDRQ